MLGGLKKFGAKALGVANSPLGLMGADFGLDWLAAKQAQRYQTNFAQNQMRWRVADLRAAGLNPILAAGNLGGAFAPGSPAMQSGGRASRGMTSATQKRLADMAFEKLENENELLYSQRYNQDRQGDYWTQKALSESANANIMETEWMRNQVLRELYNTEFGKDLIWWDTVLGGTSGNIATNAVGATAKGAVLAPSLYKFIKESTRKNTSIRNFLRQGL